MNVPFKCADIFCRQVSWHDWHFIRYANFNVFLVHHCILRNVSRHYTIGYNGS